jgi:ATP-dependent DNA helicase RecG
MPEQQHIEYKSVWKDEYLKWICGFANAQGGTLFVGKDDDGEVIGVKDAKKLLEELPNKITTVLGIVADVNLHETPEGDFIEIVVESQFHPVSCKGEYYYRSGSTNQALRGAALTQFLFSKHGKTWDTIPVPRVAVSDLKQETFEFFKEEGIRSKRLDVSVRNDTPEQLLKKLELIAGGCLTYAALLLFHPDPERFFTNAYVKIGFFQTDIDLVFQDEVHGNLFEQVEKTMELLLTKYTRAWVSYQGLHRVETGEYPEQALREVIVNAIIHKVYHGHATIQIKVYPDKIRCWNEGKLPDDWTIEKLLGNHESRPYNPLVANAFFRSGYIDAWGRGIHTITKHCIDAGLPLPTFQPVGSDFTVILHKNPHNPVELQLLGLNSRQTNAVNFVNDNKTISREQYQLINHVSKQTAITELQQLADTFQQLVKCQLANEG